MKQTLYPVASLLVVSALLLCNCSKKISNAPERSEVYQSIVASAETQLDLRRESDAFIGSGKKDGRAFTLTAVVTRQAEGFMVYEDGATERIILREHPDGSLDLVDQAGAAVALRGSGKAVGKTPTGKLSGYYRASMDIPFTLDLLQMKEYVSGIGRYGSEVVSVAGKVNKDGSITATLSFGDESAVGITAVPNDRGDVMKVTGLGKPFKLLKQS